MSVKALEMTPHGFTALREEEAREIDGGIIKIIIGGIIAAAAVAVTNALLVEFTGRNIQQWADVGVRWVIRQINGARHLVRA